MTTLEPRPYRWTPCLVNVPGSQDDDVWTPAHVAWVATRLEDGGKLPTTFAVVDGDGDRWTFEDRGPSRTWRVTDAGGQARLGPVTLAGCVALAERFGARFPTTERALRRQLRQL